MDEVMDDMTAFEHQLSVELDGMSGPGRHIDAAAMVRSAAAGSSRWRFQSLFSATKFVVAGAILALFGGLLLTGVLTQPSPEQMPAAVPSASMEPDASEIEAPTPEVTQAPEAPTPERAPGTVSPTGSLAEVRDRHTATALTDGRVLVVGGIGPDATLRSTAELWDPVTETFSPAGEAEPRADHGAALLADGRVLVLGGRGSTGDGFVGDLSSAEVWDPATESFSPAGSLLEWRSGMSMSATPLPDGRVLVVGGGEYLGGDGSALAEIWDPATESFSPAGEMAESRVGQTATLLDDGRVLVVGGILPTTERTASAEIWDPATESFSSAGSLREGRNGHTATRLLDGRVLVAGGNRGGDGFNLTASTEIWDPATESFSPAGSLLGGTLWNTASLLPDGRVLVVGHNGTSAADVWDPATASFSSTALPAEGRLFPTVTVLLDGRVLVVGGVPDDDGTVASAEIWSP